MKGSKNGVTAAYTRPSKMYSCILGSLESKQILLDPVPLLDLSFSVLTRKKFFRWKNSSGVSFNISLAIPVQPSTITYIMKKVAFIGMLQK
jgi:hypothetical protein